MSHTAPPPPPNSGPMVSGKAVILTVFGFAIAASAVSWFYYARLQERPLALWGSGPAALMLRAPRATAFRLVPLSEATAAPDTTTMNDPQRREFVLGGARYVAVESRDVASARGFSHIRQGLIHDRSFGWDDPPCAEQRVWEYALEFATDSDAAAVGFAFNCQRAALVGGQEVSIRPVTVAIEEFLKEQFPPQAAAQ